MVFKDKLKEKRVEAGLSQVELAAKVGVSSRTIQNYELGQRRPANIEIVQKLAEALNTTTEVLLGSSGMYVMDAKKKAEPSPPEILKIWSERSPVCSPEAN